MKRPPTNRTSKFPPGTTPNMLSFLDLPEKIRSKILRQAGLVRTCPISMTEESDRQQGIVWYRDEENAALCRSRGVLFPACRDTREELYKCVENCAHGPLTSGLLRVSKKIHQEASTILYGENEFVFADDVEFCWCLLRLSLDALKAMRRISVIVKLRPFRDFESVPGRWLSTLLSTIRSRCSTRKVELRLHVKNELLTRDLCAFLRLVQRMGPLGHFEVHFNNACPAGYSTNPLTICESICQHIHRKVSTPGSFRLRDLPFEIQSMIIQHTGVISRLEKLPFQGNPERLLRGPLNTCCGECKSESGRLEDDGVCYCICQGAYSSTCVCYPRRNPIFAVSATIREEALRLLHTKNKFIMGHFQDLTPYGLSCHLHSTPTATLRQLRSLTIYVETIPEEVEIWRERFGAQPPGTQANKPIRIKLFRLDPYRSSLREPQVSSIMGIIDRLVRARVGTKLVVGSSFLKLGESREMGLELESD